MQSLGRLPERVPLNPEIVCEWEKDGIVKIGVMGISLGGALAVWLTLCDERIRAADVICYSARFAGFGMRDVNLCGSQITPGLFALCDVPICRD